MIDFEVREDFSSIENISQDIVTGVEKRDEPGSWMELARQYGCKEAELGKFLEKTVRKVLDYCSKNAGTYDNGLWPGIEVIYRFWLVNSKERARFGSDLESFDAFWKKYGRRYGVEVKKNLRGRIHFFKERMMHDQRIVEVEGEGSRWWELPYLSLERELGEV